MRVYLLVTSVTPQLNVFMFKNGLVRLCTEPYKRPKDNNLENVYMHLTNYSINKNRSGPGIKLAVGGALDGRLAAWGRQVLGAIHCLVGGLSGGHGTAHPSDTSSCFGAFLSVQLHLYCVDASDGLRYCCAMLHACCLGVANHGIPSVAAV